MRVRRTLVVGLAALVPACATSGAGGASTTPPAAASPAAGAPATSRDEQALRQRAAQWWEARAYRDYRTMYALFDNQLRKRLTLEDYRAQAIPRDRLDISAAEVRSVTFKGPDRATVRIGYRVRLPQLPEAITSLLDEDWVKEGGKWNKVYFIPEPLAPPGVVTPPGAVVTRPGAPGAAPPIGMPPGPGPATSPAASPMPSPTPSPGD